MLSPRLTPKEERAFAFADDVLKQAAAFVGAAVAEVVFEDNADPQTLWPRAPLSVDFEFPRSADHGAAQPSCRVPHVGPLVHRGTCFWSTNFTKTGQVL
jgi:hypothetical protein